MTNARILQFAIVAAIGVAAAVFVGGVASDLIADNFNGVGAALDVLGR